MKPVFLPVIFLIISSISAFCQPTGEGLEVPKMTDTTPVATLLTRLDRLPPDSIKLNLLLKLSYYYWRLGKGSNLDTSLAFARQAYMLGQNIHSVTGPPQAVFMQAKVLTERNEMPAARRLLPLVYGEQRVRLLLVLAEQYINHKPVDPGYLDGALPYAQHALELADSIFSDRWHTECVMLMAKYYFEAGDITKGENAILSIIAACRRAGNHQKEAHYWTELDVYLPRTDSLYPEHLRAGRNAYNLYRAVGEKEQALFALRDLAWTELFYEHFDTAEREFDTVLTLFRDLKREPTPTTYGCLSELYLKKGDFPKALHYALKTLEGLRPTDQRMLFVAYYTLSESSFRLGATDDGLRYARLSMDIATANNFPDMYYIARMVVDGMIRKDSAGDALRFLRRFGAEHPPGSPLQERALSYGYAAIYDHLGQYANAERYFARMMQLAPATEDELKHNIFTSLYFGATDAAISIAKFYLRWGKNREALPPLLKAMNDPSMARQADDRRMLEHLLFQVYLGLSDSRSAMLHHSRYEQLNDSIYNVEKVRQFQTLQIQYETRQREQSLRLLQLQSQKEQAQLRETSLQRNEIFGGAVLLLMLSLMAYRAYQVTRRNVLKLETQQALICEQSHVQQRLLGEKDRLLTDKDLLMKEINHRVKNNLNIIISLLESQSLYLNNAAAQAALQDTQNRIQAVFLLHQKLYHTSGGTDVDAASYVLELVNHLSETFHTADQNFVFTYQLEPVSLDAAQLLPLAMILNEAVTNAIKHAFPGNRMGYIKVSLLQLPTGDVYLRVKDNGIGLPKNFQHEGERSLGFTLITGLVRQLQGTCTIVDDHGVVVTIRFRPGGALRPS